MTSPVPLTIRPGPPLTGETRVPGDKSITHRAVLIALLGPGRTVVRGANPGADCAATLACGRALGLSVTEDADLLTLARDTLHAPGAVLDCGNSGSTLRMLAGVLAGQPFEATLDGDDSLRGRPVARIVGPLRAMGAAVRARDGDRLPPLTVHGGALRPFRGRLEMASAQVASAIEFAALAASGESVIEVPGAARDHTERMLAATGIPIGVESLAGGGRRVTVVGPASPGERHFDVPGDFSSAAFLLATAAPRPGARVTVRGVGLNPTRTGLLDVIRAMGGEVRVTPRGDAGGEPVGDITIEGRDLAGFEVPAEWVPRLVDEVPAWAILAAQARGTSRLSGAAELRVKESDRLATLAAGLARLGVPVEEKPDGLVITGALIGGGSVASAGDHRIAMAFAALATAAGKPVMVDDRRSIDTSYPGFETTLASLGARLGPEDERDPA
ncbi:MAG: 3-phosphoshikimate 1-carboxyvinyltransferase [Candidatus Eisenbacteria bacterium]